DEEHHAADHGVDEEHRRAGQADDLARAEEEPGADRTADRDQLQVAVRQTALQLLVRARCCGGLRHARSLLGVVVRRHPCAADPRPRGAAPCGWREANRAILSLRGRDAYSAEISANLPPGCPAARMRCASGA